MVNYKAWSCILSLSSALSKVTHHNQSRETMRSIADGWTTEQDWTGQESLVSRRSYLLRHTGEVRGDIWHGRSEVEQEVRLSKRPSNRGGRMLRLLIKTCPRMWSSRRHEFVNFQHWMCYTALCSLRPGLVYTTQDRGQLVNTHTHTHRLSVRCPVQLWTVTLDIHSYRSR